MMRNRRIRNFIFSWIQLAEALVGIASVGTYYPGWTLSFVVWAEIRDIKSRLK